MNSGAGSLRKVTVSWRSLLAAFVFALSLAACKPNVPLTGQVTLEYSRTRKDDTVFVLANGSSQRIRFDGISPLFSDIELTAYSVTCHSDKKSEVTTAFAPLMVRPREKVIEVSPGEKVRLTIFNGFLSEFKGDHCQLDLWPKEGSAIKSNEFVL